jgi:GAF domain-containing protein
MGDHASLPNINDVRAAQIRAAKDFKVADDPAITVLTDTLRAYTELAAAVLNEHSRHAVLRRIVDLTVEVVPGATEASVTLIERGRARTVAHRGQRSAVLDEHQYRDGSGPCMDAAVTGRMIVIEDTAREGRYPDFADEARRNGIQHTLSVGMPTRQQIAGSLNIYSSSAPGPFDQATQDIATTFAGYAALAVFNAAIYAAARQEVAQMHQVMAYRAGIEQAKGILMREHRCSAEEASTILTQASGRTNRSLHDAAQAIISEATRRKG